VPGSRARSLCAEGLGTAFLLAAVVGSGIMGERLAGGNVALALLANTAATGAALVAQAPDSIASTTSLGTTVAPACSTPLVEDRRDHEPPGPEDRPGLG
jgi:glycerol uptake facilitator-like aquaporin